MSLLIDAHNPIPSLPGELIFLSSITLWMMISSSSLVKGPLSDRWLHIDLHLFYLFQKTKTEEVIISQIEFNLDRSL